MAQSPYHGQSGSGSGLGWPFPSLWPYGLWGDAEGGPGVVGTGKAIPRSSRPPEFEPFLRFSYPAGVYGEASGEGAYGVYGFSPTGTGMRGEGGRGVVNEAAGFSTATVGVHGKTNSDNNQAYGVYGEGKFGAGVRGFAAGGDGVQGVSRRFAGVSGFSTQGTGVIGTSRDGIGIHGTGGQLAGSFEGN